MAYHCLSEHNPVSRFGRSHCLPAWAKLSCQDLPVLRTHLLWSAWGLCAASHLRLGVGWGGVEASLFKFRLRCHSGRLFCTSACNDLNIFFMGSSGYHLKGFFIAHFSQNASCMKARPVFHQSESLTVSWAFFKKKQVFLCAEAQLEFRTIARKGGGWSPGLLAV